MAPAIVVAAAGGDKDAQWRFAPLRGGKNPDLPRQIGAAWF
jgi:hypothetical protein